MKGDEKTFSIISKESDWDGKKVPRLGIVKLDLWILQKGLTIGPSGVNGCGDFSKLNMRVSVKLNQNSFP